MVAISNFLEDALINHVLRATAYASPVNVELALFTADPTDADIGTEVVGGSYARETLTGNFGVPSNGVTLNAIEVSFTTATAGWGTVTHVGIFDTGSADLLFHGQLSSSRTVNNGDTFVIPIGNLTVSLA